jgi:hypothetical protein
MSAQRLRLILLGLLGLGALVFLVTASFGMSKLSAESQDMVDLKKQSQLLDAQLDSLSSAKKDIQQYSYFKDVAKTVIPSDKDQAQAVLDISQFANQSGFLIGTMTFPISTLAKSAAGSTPTSTGTTSTNAASATSSQVISQAKPVSGISGLYSIELTVTPQTGCDLPPSKAVTYAKMLNFMQKIERNRRTAQISSVTVEPVVNQQCGVQFNFNLAVNIFLKP